MKKASSWCSLLLLAIFAFPVAMIGAGVSFTPAVLAEAEDSSDQMPPEEESQDHEILPADSALLGDHDLSVSLLPARSGLPEPDLFVPPPPPDGLLNGR